MSDVNPTSQPSLPLDAIKVGNRHRKDMGDIPALAKSIDAIGLLQDVVVRPDNTLVAGARRLEAVKLLGWDSVTIKVVHGLEDERKALLAERDENTERKNFTRVEAASIAKSLELKAKVEAKERQRAGGKAAGRGRGKPIGSEKFSEPIAGAGEAQAEIAAIVGMSAPTLAKIEVVIEDGVPALVEAMNKEEVSVDAAAAVATLPAKEQEEVVAKGPRAVKKKAKEVKEANKEKARTASGKIKASIVEAMEDGEFRTVEEITEEASATASQFTNVFKHHKPTAKQPFYFQKNGDGKTARYRLLKTKNFIDPQTSARLAQDLAPLIKAIVKEAKKDRSSISTIALCELAQKIQKIIESPAFASVFVSE